MLERLRSLSNLEDGLGLVEVIVAMFVLFVLAIAILPALLGATSLSVTNKTLLAATNAANQRIAAVRAAYPNDSPATGTCSNLSLGYPQTTAVDPNTGITTTTTISGIPSCAAVSSTAPGIATVTVTAGSASKPALVTISTKILVMNP